MVAISKNKRSANPESGASDNPELDGSAKLQDLELEVQLGKNSPSSEHEPKITPVMENEKEKENDK